MADDLHSFARRIDALDEIIDSANADKAEAYREAKKALGEDLPAFREAMARRRKRAKAPAKYEALQDRAAEILDALDNGVVIRHARAPARAREITEPDRAETPEARPQAGEERATAPADPTPKSTAPAAPLASSSPPGERDAPPKPDAVDADPDAGWQSKDGAAGYELAHRIAGGKVPVGDVDRAKTLAVIERCRAADDGIDNEPDKAVPMGARVAAAAAAAAAALAVADWPEIPAHLRRGSEANKAAREGR